MKKIYIVALSIFLSIAMQAQNDRQQPKPGPAPKVNVGKPQSFTLANGLKVMVVENSKLPRVSFNLQIDNAPYTEGSKKGVDDLTSALMGKGTTKISKDAFNEEIDFLGADINFTSSGAKAYGLSKYAGRILELMAQGSLDPNFTQEELDKEKAKLIEGLKSNEKNVATTLARVENVLAFGKNHPNGEFLSEQTINNVTLNDVIAHYHTYFVPTNAYLVVIGDVKLADVKAKVEKAFAEWDNAVAPQTTFVNPRNVQYSQINFIDMPNAVQSEIAVVNTTNLKMTDKDYFAALMANQILGGGAEGRLFLNLREKHAWTYGSYSSVGAGKYTTKFRASAQVRNAVTDSAVVEILNELKKIRTDLVSDADLSLAKSKFVGNFVMQIQKPETVARYALLTETQKLPADFYENYIKNITAVTPQDVLEAAKKYFLADNIRIIVAGKGSEVLTGLEKLKIPMFYYDKFGTPVQKPEEKKVDPSITVKTVVDKYIAAIGGETAIKKVKTVAIISKGTVQGQALDFTIKSSSEGKLAIDMLMPAMGMTIMKQRITQDSGYAENQGQKKVYEGDELKAKQEQAHPFFELGFVNNPNVSLVGIEKVNDIEAYVLKTSKARMFYDIKTGYRVAVETEKKNGDQVTKSVIYYNDYKDVKGVKYPFKMNVEGGPMPLEFTVNEVKVNEGVSNSDFK
ncbi:MAG: insulinase family protein [Limnohabitans sp.]|nr:insulinase family protein [Limnohabitans sp.]